MTPVYELRDVLGHRWTASRMPTFQEIEAMRAEAPRVTLYRDNVPLAVFRRDALVMVCAWCRDSREQTASARAHGFDITHGICPSCQQKWEANHVAR